MIFIVLSAVEIPIVDLIVHRWPAVRIAFLILGIWGVTWMFGLLCAYLMRPHTVGPDGIRVRQGLETDIALGWDDIASVARVKRVDEPKSPRIEETDASRTLVYRMQDETDIEIELERPTVVRLPGARPARRRADDHRAPHLGRRPGARSWTRCASTSERGPPRASGAVRLGLLRGLGRLGRRLGRSAAGTAGCGSAVSASSAASASASSTTSTSSRRSSSRSSSSSDATGSSVAASVTVFAARIAAERARACVASASSRPTTPAASRRPPIVVVDWQDSSSSGVGTAGGVELRLGGVAALHHPVADRGDADGGDPEREQRQVEGEAAGRRGRQGVLHGVGVRRVREMAPAVRPYPVPTRLGAEPMRAVWGSGASRRASPAGSATGPRACRRRARAPRRMPL